MDCISRVNKKKYKNVASYIEQILEATPNETSAVQPLTSHLKNFLSKMNKTCRTLLEKQEHSSLHPPVLDDQQELIYISLEYLPGAMDNRDIHRGSGKFVLAAQLDDNTSAKLSYFFTVMNLYFHFVFESLKLVYHLVLIWISA